jgi:transcriptional regulator with XRE-family HTH domain
MRSFQERIKVGRTVRRVREANGLTQALFGKRFDVSQSIVSEWEAGTRRPSRTALSEIMALAKPKEAAIIATALSTYRVSAFAPSNHSMVPAAEGGNV